MWMDAEFACAAVANAVEMLTADDDGLLPFSVRAASYVGMMSSPDVKGQSAAEAPGAGHRAVPG
jgi:hypothetical protein